MAITPDGRDQLIAQRDEARAQLAMREAQLAALEAQLAAQEAQLATLSKQLATAVDAITRLTEKQSRNSTNSNLPPSSDGPGAASRGLRKPKAPKSKRKRGGQKGRRGAHRQLLEPGHANKSIELFPDACEGCARSLQHVLDIDARRYQHVDLLLTGPFVTEWRRHAVVCSCGHSTRAPYDRSKIPASPFGPRLVSVIGAMTGVYHLSRRNAQKFLQEVFGINVSLGALSQMESRVSGALKSAADEAHRDTLAARVKHTDATSWLMAGQTLSLWTLCTKQTSFFKIFDDGARATVQAMFADDYGMQTGILVSDRASVFGFWPMELRQICWAHLLRLFVSFSQRDGPVKTFGRELLDYAALVFEYWHGFVDGTLSRDELACWMEPLRRRFEALLARITAAGLSGCSGSCKNLRAHAPALWTFVEVANVDPTNNLAERDLRSLVIWRRLCFGSQSERGLRFVERVMTVAHTLRKRSVGVLEFIERSVAAHLSGMPAPALLAT